MSREELLALIAARAETIESLTARLDALEAENAELKRRLAQNSRNSSKPPSSDGPEHTPPPRSLRRKTGRNPGKQPGAQGFSLKLVDDPDVIVDHVPDAVAAAGTTVWIKRRRWVWCAAR
jgi:transposase